LITAHIRHRRWPWLQQIWRIRLTIFVKVRARVIVKVIVKVIVGVRPRVRVIVKVRARPAMVICIY
jgi:hypothetical protein